MQDMPDAVEVDIATPSAGQTTFHSVDGNGVPHTLQVTFPNLAGTYSLSLVDAWNSGRYYAYTSASIDLGVTFSGCNSSFCYSAGLGGYVAISHTYDGGPCLQKTYIDFSWGKSCALVTLIPSYSNGYGVFRDNDSYSGSWPRRPCGPANLPAASPVVLYSPSGPGFQFTEACRLPIRYRDTIQVAMPGGSFGYQVEFTFAAARLIYGATSIAYFDDIGYTGCTVAT